MYEVSGKVVWHVLKLKGFRPKKLTLFTTLDLPIKDIIELYRQRWNVELDIRDIKSTLNMDMLEAKSPEMVEKELVLGITAYNLVRHLMIATANMLKVNVRDLSFARTLK